jgi:NADH-quinone oxidoreductase subunit M
MAMMAGCGLPGFANFVGEATVFFGAWQVFPWVTTLALWGALVIGGVYMTRAIRNILHGPLPAQWDSLFDAAHFWHKLPYALLLVCLLVFGFAPKLLTEKINPDAEKVVSSYQLPVASDLSPVAKPADDAAGNQPSAIENK